MNIKGLLIFIFSFSIPAIYAQSAIVVAGGNATGSGGHASYTIGQIVYNQIIGANGSATQGVQQPFEITTLGVDNFPAITLQMVVYPNPTIQTATLKISNFKTAQFYYQLMDITGKQLGYEKIAAIETQLPLEQLNAALYFLNIIENQTIIKTFKILKN